MTRRTHRAHSHGWAELDGFLAAAGSGISDSDCGDPGIGKSTLPYKSQQLRNGQDVVYVSGEEAAAQIQERAERLVPRVP